MRQLTTYDQLQKKKKKQSIEFPVVLGDFVEMCPGLEAAESAVKELAFYRLPYYTSRAQYDPYRQIRKVASVKFIHKFHLEDYWASVEDDLEVRRKMYYRLPLDTIRISEIYQVSDWVKEDSDEKVKDQPI